MENAVVYARYSSYSQTEQSIEGQLNAAYKYAKEHNYKIVKEYCDRAKTGTNDNREEFQKMLKDTNKKKFSVIIVWKVDRFGRNREEITFNKYKCKKNGVRVEYVAENISNGPEGVILESVLEGMAEYYSLQLSQNVKRGYLESAKKHHVIGVAPLGYTRDENKCYKIVPGEAKIVKKIFNMYNAGESQIDIIRYLNSRGYKRCGKDFTKSTIQRILNDERYIGTFTYKDLIREENVIPPIVSKDTFYANRRPKNTWSYEEYKLSPILYCGVCGNRMKGSSGYNSKAVKYKYYICSRCKHIHIRSERLEQIVDTNVKKILSDDIIDKISGKLYEYYLERNNEPTEEDDLKRNIDEISRKIDNLLLSIEKGLSPETVVPRIKNLELERDDLTKRLTDIQIKKPFVISLDAVKFFLKNVDTTNFISKIVLSKSSLKIVLNCVDTELTVSSSTITRIMAFPDQEPNIFICDYLAIVVIPL